MHHQIPTRLNQEELDLERQLQEMLPARHGLDRDTLMFQAGERSAQRRAHQWRALSMMLAVTTGILAVASFGRQSGYSSLEVAVAPAELELAVSASATVPAARIDKAAQPENLWPFRSGPEFLGLRERLISQGLDALPTPVRAVPSPDVPNSLRDWLRQSRAGDGLNLSECVNVDFTLGEPS
jgi:uncharacterized membrane protein YccC